MFHCSFILSNLIFEIVAIFNLRENNLFTVGVLEGDHFVSLISGKKFKVNTVTEPEGIKINAPIPDLGQVEVQGTSQSVESAVFGEKIVK